MGGVSNRPQMEGMGGWMRDIERRLVQEERRPSIRSAQQILGPGFGPFATEIVDWNSDEALFTGQFYSLVGSLNSPDPLDAWIGETHSISSGSGVQVLSAFLGGDARYHRSFITIPGSLATYSAWLPIEGTWAPWTPTVTAETGTITTSSSSDCEWTQIGLTAIARGSLIITTVGSGAGGLRFTLPVAPGSGAKHIGTGRESQATGALLQVTYVSGSTAQIVDYANTGILASGRTADFLVEYKV